MPTQPDRDIRKGLTLLLNSSCASYDDLTINSAYKGLIRPIFLEFFEKKLHGDSEFQISYSLLSFHVLSIPFSSN